MGGINSFKKHGKGMLFLDDGSTALTDYSNDNMVGHNVVYKDGFIISIDVAKNRSKNICYRSSTYLLTEPYNSSNEKEGVGIFLEFLTKKIFRLYYHRNRLTRKISVNENDKL